MNYNTAMFMGRVAVATTTNSFFTDVKKGLSAPFLVRIFRLEDAILNRFVVLLRSTDTNGLFNRINKDFAIADFTGFGGL